MYPEREELYSYGGNQVERNRNSLYNEGGNPRSVDIYPSQLSINQIYKGKLERTILVETK